MHCVRAVGIGGWVYLFPEFMPVISGTAVVEAVKSIAAIAVGKDCCVPMLVGAVEGAFCQLVLHAGADRDFLCDLNVMV